MEPKYQDQYLMQSLLSKQELLQLQHQRNVCETIFSTVSSAEKVALKLSKNKEYTYYDPMNSASFKNEMQLENELASKLVYCKYGLEAYNIQHGKFIFPDNNIRQEMINDIKKWEFYVKNRPKALQSFQTLIQLIEGNTVEISDKCFHKTNIQPTEKSTLDWANDAIGTIPKLMKQDEKVKEAYERGESTIPFYKNRKNSSKPVDLTLFNAISQSESNMEKYLEILLKQECIDINSKEKMKYFINEFSKSLKGIKIDKQHASSKMSQYDNIISACFDEKIKQTGKQEGNMGNTHEKWDIISDYCIAIKKLYNYNQN